MIVKYTIKTWGQEYSSEVFLDNPTMENLKKHLRDRFDRYELISSTISE